MIPDNPVGSRDAAKIRVGVHQVDAAEYGIGIGNADQLPEGVEFAYLPIAGRHACCVFIRREIDAGIVPALVCRIQRIEKQPGAFQRAAIQLNVRFQNDPLIIGYRGQGRGTEVMIQAARSEEHTSELQSLMRISYAVFCLKKKRATTPTL